MRTRGRRAGVVLGVLMSGAAISACSSAPGPSSATSLSPGTTTSTTAVSPTTTTTTTAPPATTTTAANTTCTPSQLHVVASGFEGAAGTLEITFSLTNTSSTLCTMTGYPGLQLLSASGAPEQTTVVRGGPLSFENIAETTVSLTSGQTAYFNVGYSDVTSGTTACVSASQVAVTPPNGTSSAVVSVSPAIDACSGGKLNVSPVFASTDSAATQTTAPPS